MATFRPRVLSGVQPTGSLHLGNYLGAIKNWVKLQESTTASTAWWTCTRSPCRFEERPKALRRATREVTAAYLAAGIDPERSILFNQSQVAAARRACLGVQLRRRLGWLNRMTQFKEKAGKDRENASIGLFDYPVLMAADILAYRGTHVPVGEDQKQHLELARDIAHKFNNDFSESIAATAAKPSSRCPSR